MAADDRSFRQVLTGERFAYGVELVTTRGPSAPDAPAKPVELGEALAGDARLGWLSVTDNAGGHPALSSDAVARTLRQRCPNVVVHLTCKDLNRNGIESLAWRLASEGLTDVLALTGDYPTEGYNGLAKPVFDLDSTALVSLLHAMNQGLEVPGRKGPVQLPKTDFFIGCAVSPFKSHEAELLPQYRKLLRKVACGADWVIPQLGYDMRKFHEVQLLLAWAGLDRPVVGNVYVLNKTVAGMFNRNAIPGCVVSDELMALVERHAGGPDKGRRFFQELAARQLAVFRGLGFAAGYLGGIHKPDAFTEIVDLAESYGSDDWMDFARELQYPQPDEFYLFERDEATGLGQAGQLNRAYLQSLDKPRRTRNVTLGYRLSRRMHDRFFTPGGMAFALGGRIYGRLDGHDGFVGRGLHAFERAVKALGYGCRDCGDCSLPDCAYLCPMASCSKCGRNGPCGGSRDGICELQDKTCLWVRAYERLKYHRQTDRMLQGPPVYSDAALQDTSSWANTFLRRDHHAKTASGQPEQPNGKDGQRDGH